MGPASSKKNTLRAMMRAGMDIARFNFSHGSHEEHRGRVDMVKNLREELNIPVALLLDTKGPEIRTKLLKDHKKITLEAGSEFTLTTGDIEGDETRVAITYENLYKDVKKGGKILIDDGLIELEIENIKEIVEVCERCTKMPVDPRHPYAGKLVFTAFSGSHQDAISKGMQALSKRTDGIWEVPYLPIDPSDIGREYEPVVRINSQSGKGGVAFVMDSFYGFRLPKGMHKEFADIIQKIAEKQGEVAPEQIMDEFRANYLDRKEPMHFKKCQITDKEYEGGAFATVAILTFTDHDTECTVEGVGNGPIDAVQRAIEEALGIEIRVLDYNEHALRSGSGAQAASYIHLMDVKSGRATYGVGISSNITRASIRGIFSAVNRLFY